MRTGEKIAISITIVIALLIIVFLWFKPTEFKGREIDAVYKPTVKENSLTPSVEESETVEDKLSFGSVEEAKKYVEEYAEKKGYDINAYPEKLYELMVKDETAIDFVLDYPAEINEEHKAVIEKSNDNGRVPLLLQWDKGWGYHQFKNGVVGLDGCGAVCMSMAAVYLNDDVSLTPDLIADYASDNGYFVDGSGMSWSFFEKGVAKYSLKSNSISVNEAKLKQAVENNHPVVVSVREGDFTKKGHYIVIAGYEDGKYIVNDPYSLVNSQKLWSWDRLQPQIKNMWEIYK